MNFLTTGAKSRRNLTGAGVNDTAPFFLPLGEGEGGVGVEEKLLLFVLRLGCFALLAGFIFLIWILFLSF